MLLSWIFISTYTTIYFFVKINLFFRMFMFQCVHYMNVAICYFGWRSGLQLIIYAIGNRLGWVTGSPKKRTATYRDRCCHASCVRTHLHYLFLCFWQHFCLIVSCYFCRNLNLPLFKKEVSVRNGYYSSTRSMSSWNKLFYNT